MRNVYREGFDFKALHPVDIKEGRVIVKGIVPSDFNQIVGTDHLNEMTGCRIWEVIAVSDGVKEIEKGNIVVVLKAGVDKIDPDEPRYGIIPAEAVIAKMQ